MKWTCTCEDEFVTNNCSGECDLCGFAEPVDEGQTEIGDDMKPNNQT